MRNQPILETLQRMESRQCRIAFIMINLLIDDKGKDLEITVYLVYLVAEWIPVRRRDSAT